MKKMILPLSLHKEWFVKAKEE
jgi:hypothetical protein